MSDLDIIATVRAACVAHDGQDPLDEKAALGLKHRGLDGAELWVEEGGFALVREGDLTLAVDPAARRRGLGGRLLEQAVRAAPAHAWSHGDHPAAALLAEHIGWRRARDLWVMRRPTALALPALELPDSVHVRGYRESDEAQLLAINAAAFAQHPEQGEMDSAELAERMAEPWFDPAGLLVAIEGSELLGFHWTKQHDAETGEVYVVAVGPRAQGRGLGRVLTLAGLHHLAETGVDEVLLYVESDNAPAVRLYSSTGFTHSARDTHVQYSR
ncbi:MAG: mycothiol synthase [Nocardioides sp.]